MSCSHGRQSTPSSAPEVNSPGGLLTIGELARRAGVTASALRYYEELGLLPPPARISGAGRARCHQARTALPHEDITQCPNFNAGITARLAGQPLSQSHQQLHGQQFDTEPQFSCSF